jgi:flagellar secretion chaperone FliS
MATDQNPYQAYTDGVVFSDNPLNLVVALYQGALDATQQAERALRAKDIMGRGRAINRANAILSELLSSLDDERGGEISYNLKRLYSYMQVQLLAAHARQSAGPILEVSALLETLLEGWRVAATTPVTAPERPHPVSQRTSKVPAAAHLSESVPFYGGYVDDSAALACSAYSF